MTLLDSRSRRLYLALVVSAIACSEPTDPGPNPSGPVVASITLNVNDVELTTGLTFQLQALAFDASGNQISGAVVSFSSANSSIASTTAGGLVRGEGFGGTTIQARSGSARATVNVVVRGRPLGSTVSALPLTGRPYGLGVSQAGLILTGRQDDDRVSRVDFPAQLQAAEFLVGPDPGDLALNAGATRAYVSNYFGASFAILDLTTNVVLATVPLPNPSHEFPFRPLVSPTGNRLYLSVHSDAGLNKLYVYDLANNQMIRSFAVGSEPNGIALHPSGTFLYVSSKSGIISEINVQQNVSVRSLVTSGEPQDLVMHPGGSELYVANEAGWVEVWSLPAGTRLTTIPVPGGAFGLALSPDGTQLYATLAREGKVAVIDRASRSLVRVVPLGGRPRRVAFSPNGATAIIADEALGLAFIR